MGPDSHSGFKMVLFLAVRPDTVDLERDEGRLLGGNLANQGVLVVQSSLGHRQLLLRRLRLVRQADLRPSPSVKRVGVEDGRMQCLRRLPLHDGLWPQSVRDLVYEPPC